MSKLSPGEGCGDGRKGQILGFGICEGMIQPPLFEETTVAVRDVLAGLNAEQFRGTVNPIVRAFELGKVADGRFIHHAMAFAVLPLGAPFFIAEGRNQAEREKHMRQRVAVGNNRLRLDAMLVCVFARAGIRQTLVGENPKASVVADTDNFGACAHGPIRGIVEDVALEAAVRLNSEARSFKPAAYARQVLDAEFDFSLDRHRLQ